MKNNKGFSILELIVSFTLTMVIVVILFEIIVAMKDVYEKSVTKTELLNKQNIFTDLIYSDFNNLGLDDITTCGDNCIQFIFKDYTSKNLTWGYDTVSSSNNQNINAFYTLQYGDYKINLIPNSSFDENLNVEYNGTNLRGIKMCKSIGMVLGDVYDSYIYINLPIYNTMFKNKDFGLNIFYAIKSEDIVFGVKFANFPMSEDNCSA